MKIATLAFWTLLLVLVYPTTTVADPEHPDKAPCHVCIQHGETHHGEETVKGISTYEGTTYYFCSENCKKAFDADPAGYMPQVFPRPAPELRVSDLSGEKPQLEAYAGSVLLVDFWATWCKPCIEIMPKLNTLHKDFDEQGLEILGISIDEDPKKVVKFLSKRKVDYRIAMDDLESPTWTAYGVKAVPTSFLIGRDGQIVARWVGKPDIDEVQKAVSTLLEQPAKSD